MLTLTLFNDTNIDMLEHSQLLLSLAGVFGFFMAWGVGANDVANAMGTSVGSKALTIKQAILIAVVFETLGALLAGSQVTDTIRSQIINVTVVQDPNTYVIGMLAALLAAGTWLVVATNFGWPVSTTHSIVGALVGFGVVCLGGHAIHWHRVIHIALSWIFIPIIAAVLAYLLFMSVQRLIFWSKEPTQRARTYIPIYILLSSLVIGMITLVQGLKMSFFDGLLWVLPGSTGLAFLGRGLVSSMILKQKRPHREQFKQVEKMFGVLMIFTAAAMAFAHGSNDVANAIGPLAAVVNLIQSGGQLQAVLPLPSWILVLGAGGIVLGLLMFGYKVIATIGTNITQLTPSRGFAAQLATATAVVIATGIGMPVSTTHTMVGAVLGVGLARGMGALNLTVIRNIFMSWMITLPVGAVLAIVFFYLLRLVL